MNGAMLSCTCSSPPGDGAVSNSEDTNEANLETYLNKEASQDSDSAAFAGVKSDSVTTEIYMSAGPFSTAAIQSTSNLFEVQAVAGVPEPSTWAMIVVGFAGLGWPARRRLFAGVGAPGYRNGEL